jgi:hypothetical protein
MKRHSYDFIGSEPCLKECRTMRIEGELSLCLATYTECKYAVPAAATKNYCQHPAHKRFQHESPLRWPGEALLTGRDRSVPSSL